MPEKIARFTTCIIELRKSLEIQTKTALWQDGVKSGSGSWTRTNDIRINSNNSTNKKIGCNRQKSGIFIVYYCVKMKSSMQICTFLDWSKTAFNSIKNSTLYTFSRNNIVWENTFCFLRYRERFHKRYRYDLVNQNQLLKHRLYTMVKIEKITK